MAVSDLDIDRAARDWKERHGDDAVTKAREMVEQMRRKRDAESADTWLRIIVAIGMLETSPTIARN